MSSAQVLRDGALRVTSQRQSVLAVLGELPHASAGQIATALADGPTLSKQGLYNVLDALVRAGLVRRIQPAGSVARYELRVGDEHHHVVCRGCGRMEDVESAVGATPCLDPVNAAPLNAKPLNEDPAPGAGFVIDEAEVIWWGRCVDCRV